VKRVCPLLEKETPTRQLDYAPAPWVLLECQESGFVFLENPPGYEALNEEYAWEVTYSREAQAREEKEPLLYSISNLLKQFRSRVLKRNKVAKLGRQEVLQRLDLHEESVNLLDVGCGWGQLLGIIIADLPQVARSRCIPHGIEISQELARISAENLAKANGTCVHDNAVNGMSQFPSDYFDVIVLSSFLEHEIEPLPLLRACKERLRSGGSVIVKVPNYASFNRHLRKEKWCGFRWPDHVNYFTPNSLKRMAEYAGLEVARMTFLDRHPLSDSMYAVLRKP